MAAHQLGSPLGPGAVPGCSPVTAKKQEKRGEGALQGLWVPRRPLAPQQDSVSQRRSVRSKDSGCPLRDTAALARNPPGCWAGVRHPLPLRTQFCPNRPTPRQPALRFCGRCWGRAESLRWGGCPGSQWQGAQGRRRLDVRIECVPAVVSHPHCGRPLLVQLVRKFGACAGSRQIPSTCTNALPTAAVAWSVGSGSRACCCLGSRACLQSESVLGVPYCSGPGLCPPPGSRAAGGQRGPRKAAKCPQQSPQSCGDLDQNADP